jgi:hypothetical protein
MRLLNYTIPLLVLPLLGPALSGCMLDNGGTSANPDMDACTVLMTGQGMTINASATADIAMAPTVNDNRTRYDIALPSTGSTNKGFVEFQTAGKSYIIYLDKTVTLAVMGTDNRTVAATSTATSAVGCALVKQRNAYTLTVGTYFFQIGPTSESVVGMVIVRTTPTTMAQ